MRGVGVPGRPGAEVLGFSRALGLGAAEDLGLGIKQQKGGGPITMSVSIAKTWKREHEE